MKKKRFMPTWVNTLTPWSYAHDWDNSIESKEKKWHEDQFSINEMLKDEIEKKINFRKWP